jgi:hypothetical protein
MARSFHCGPSSFYAAIPSENYPPRIMDCRRCLDGCFCRCESPLMVFGPIAIGPACIWLFWKREAISWCARSLQRSASPNHFQLCARSEMARCLHNDSISRQPITKLFIANSLDLGCLRPALPSRFDPLESIVCFKNEVTADLTHRCQRFIAAKAVKGGDDHAYPPCERCLSFPPQHPPGNRCR